MTGEPALTAVRLLASQQETNALLLYLLSGTPPSSEVVGETLRGLATLEFSILEPLLMDLAGRDDDGLLVAICDVLVEIPPSPGLAPLVRKLLDSPSRGEVYEFLVTSIVASRRDDLVQLVLESLPLEMSQKRLRSALEALRLAPASAEVLGAIAQLDERLARQSPPSR
jgi:hypothetical protein